MAAEVKFSLTVPALDALRRILRRDFERDQEVHQQNASKPEKERSMEVVRELYRYEADRDLIERALGLDSSKDEIGKDPR